MSELPTSPVAGQNLWRRLLVTQFAVFAAVCLYGVWTQRYLYGDGCNFLVMLMQRQSPTDYFPGRHFAHLATQMPMVALIKYFGCRSAWVAGSVYGATLYLAPLCCLLLTMWAANRAPGQVLAYPIIAFSILFLDNYGFIISEINLATALFWPMLYILLFSERLTVVRSLVLIALATVSTRCYEIYLFLAWPLAVAALYRLWLATQAKNRAEGWVSIVSLCLFLKGFWNAARSIWDPDIPASVDGFFDHVSVHLYYPPVWFTLAYLLVAAWILTLPELRRGRWIIHGFVIGFAIFALLLNCIGFVGPWFQYSSRVQALYVPLLLGTIVILKTMIPRLRLTASTKTQMELWRLTAGACCVAAAFQIGSTVAWERYRASVLAVLAKNQGIVGFEAATGTDRKEEESSRLPVGLTNAKVGQFYWNWTMPSLSVALSAMNFGSITTIICAPEMTEWQPFDPQNPAEIPDLSIYGVKNHLPPKVTIPANVIVGGGTIQRQQ